MANFCILVTRLISHTVLILARLGSIVLAIVTLWYGFALGAQQPLDFQTGYFNTAPIRFALLAGIMFLQM